MPTGYTKELMERGQSFGDFFNLCAQGIAKRGSVDGTCTGGVYSTWSPRFYELTPEEKAKALEISDDEVEEFARSLHKRKVDTYKAMIAVWEEQNERLAEMKRYIKDWWVPVGRREHRITRLMEEQLTISKNDTKIAARAVARIEDSAYRIAQLRDRIFKMRRTTALDLE